MKTFGKSYYGYKSYKKQIIGIGIGLSKNI